MAFFGWLLLFGIPTATLLCWFLFIYWSARRSDAADDQEPRRHKVAHPLLGRQVEVIIARRADGSVAVAKAGRLLWVSSEGEACIADEVGEPWFCSPVLSILAR